MERGVPTAVFPNTMAIKQVAVANFPEGGIEGTKGFLHKGLLLFMLCSQQGELPKACGSWHQYPACKAMSVVYFSTSQTAAFVLFTCTPHLCSDKQDPTLFPFQKPYKKDTRRSDSSETWLQLVISLPFWGEGRACANGRCCCPFIPRERFVSNIISFNSLVESILRSEASQTPRSTACKYACGEDHLQLSGSVRKGGEWLLYAIQLQH